jgi:CRISPR-associated protein Cas1
MGETYKAYKVMRQAELVSDPIKRKQVVVAMYQQRFDHELDESLSLPQIRGHEGVRMRETYAAWSKKTGVVWDGRNYSFQDWGGSPINRALSSANAILNAICNTVIVSAGYSTALGFIHQGRQLSFVYDIADLYKTEITIPSAFCVVGESENDVEKRVRVDMRERVYSSKLVSRILPDIDNLLKMEDKDDQSEEYIDPLQTHPIPLWEALFSDEERQ